MFENLEPGTYKARLTDWALEINPYLNVPEVIIGVDFEADGAWQSMKFKGLWLTKAGGVNKKTRMTLNAIGYTDEDPRGLTDWQADMAQDLEVTVGKNEKGYWQIDWLNKMGEKVTPKATKTLDDFFGKKPGNAPQKPAVKNYAPKAKVDERNGDDELPF